MGAGDTAGAAAAAIVPMCSGGLLRTHHVHLGAESRHGGLQIYRGLQLSGGCVARLAGPVLVCGRVSAVPSATVSCWLLVVSLREASEMESGSGVRGSGEVVRNDGAEAAVRERYPVRSCTCVISGAKLEAFLSVDLNYRSV